MTAIRIPFVATDPGHILQSSLSNNKADFFVSDSMSIFQMFLNEGGQRDMTNTTGTGVQG